MDTSCSTQTFKIFVLALCVITSASIARLDAQVGRPEFEVAEIKPSPEPQQTRYTGEEVQLEATLKELVGIGFNIPRNLVNDLVVAPQFTESRRYLVVAKMPTGLRASAMTVGPFVRTLLEDRFGLAFHREMRPTTVWALVRAGATDRLTKAAGTAEAACSLDRQAATEAIPMAFSCHNATMTLLAETLQRVAAVYFDHPVVNATGLDGSWDFDIRWTPLRGLPVADNNGSAIPGGVSVFDAVSQLNLKLQKEQQPVSVVVVDHVEIEARH